MSRRASIIIATYRRPDLLAGCLEALLADRPAAGREILVVDNASGDATADVVAGCAGRAGATPVRHILELRPGQVHARNRGVAEALGDVLLFLDDDMLVEAGWTDRLVASLDDPDAIAATGRVLPVWPVPPPAWLARPHADLVASPDYGRTRRPLDVGGREHLLGNNMAVHARAVRSIRPLFDPAIGHAGSLSMGGDDVFLTRRLAALGPQWYEPAAVAHHRILADRLERDWVRRRFWQGGFGQARVDRRCGVREEPLARRTITAARATRGAWALRRRNARRHELGPEEASAELSAFLWAGMHVEMLLGRFPRLTGWLAAHGCP